MGPLIPDFLSGGSQYDYSIIVFTRSDIFSESNAYLQDTRTSHDGLATRNLENFSAQWRYRRSPGAAHMQDYFSGIPL